MKYGLQLYSVRDVAGDNLQRALKDVSAIGYENIEFAGFFGHKASEVMAWLHDYGLSISGTHTGLNALEEDYKGTVQYHHDMGCTRLIIPYARVATAGELQTWIKALQTYQERLARDGITLLYHNHAFEFEPVDGGSSMWDALVNDTNLPLEVDTYWMYVGKHDPLQWMKTLHTQNRLPVIHLKDGLQDGKGMPLGQGTAPVKAIHGLSTQLSIPMVVESETCTPSGMDEARICMDYLKSL